MAVQVLPQQYVPGPGWANMEANNAGIQSLLGGLAAMQQAKQQRAQQSLLSELLAAQTPQAMAQTLQRPQYVQNGPQSTLGKIFDVFNPTSPSRNVGPLGQAVGQNIIGQRMQMADPLYQAKMQHYLAPPPDPYADLSPADRQRAIRIDMGLEPRATAAPAPKSALEDEYTRSRIERNRAETERAKQGPQAAETPNALKTLTPTQRRDMVLDYFDQAIDAQPKYNNPGWGKGWGKDAYSAALTEFSANLEQLGVSQKEAKAYFDVEWDRRSLKDAGNKYWGRDYDARDASWGGQTAEANQTTPAAAPAAPTAPAAKTYHFRTQAEAHEFYRQHPDIDPAAISYGN